MQPGGPARLRAPYIPSPAVRSGRCQGGPRSGSEMDDRIDRQCHLVMLSAVGCIAWIVERLGPIGPFEKQFRADGDRIADPVYPPNQVLRILALESGTLALQVV